MELLLGRAKPAEPEHLPHHGRVLQQRLLGRRQRVESRGDDALHRLRQVLGAATLGEHAHILLRVQRVSPAPLEQVLRRLGAERPDQLRRLVVGER
jgi:hypothetical protein